ncbi:nucleotidyl transferase AbiEii/AbiGii toxin family protein [Streptomyces sp. NPDC006393]|uniref:nucleotidyl transferase AbiEii/AbiGii toxin family protein n=1 Tax=Streptomyces sp. NPDC006393 TaxID=3156763 RepID=UPI0033E9F723
MSGSWEGFGRRSDTVPRAPLDDEARSRLDLPSTLRPIPDEGVVQRPVFDPALKQYSNAYRAADPYFTDDDAERAWRAARRTAIGLVLSAISDSPWADSLVLRGSVLLRAWFGDAAREPGDLDFVVVPQSWRIDESRTQAMFSGLARAAEAAAVRGAGGDRLDPEGGAVGPEGGAVRIIAADAASDDIWTYDRVPGRRMILPWTCDGLPGGVVQMDFVFNEHLAVAPEPTLLPWASGGRDIILNTATPELSLAWKLMWLLTDAHPQGKDLYDAVLLAEHTPLRFDLLREVLLDAEPSEGCRPVGPGEISALAQSVEWNHFIVEYPDIPGTAADRVDRLVTALAPTFAGVEPAGEADGEKAGGEYARHARWLEPRIRDHRQLLHRTSMRTVQKRMSAAGIPVIAAIVITRELLGPDRHSLEDARAVVFADPAWARLADVYGHRSGWLDRELERLHGAG